MRTALICISVMVCSLAFGQTAPGKLTFEVASVRLSNRPNALPQGGGGPGSRYDPERLHLESMPMRNLLMMTYGVDRDQISGLSWLESERYDIDATIAPGATKEQFNAMFQYLLAERFGLKAHHEIRELAGTATLGVAQNPRAALEGAGERPDRAERKAKKLAIDVMVIEHFEKSPAEN